MTSRPLRAAISPARSAALRALTRPACVDAADEGEFIHAPQFETLSPADRGLAEHLRRGVLQNLRLIDQFLADLEVFRAPRTPIGLRWILRMAVYQKVFLASIPEYAIVQQAVEQARLAGGEKAAGFVNSVLRRILAALPPSAEAIDGWLAERHAPVPPALRYSVPTPLAAVLAEAYGADALEPLLRSANEEPSPVWIRVNRLRTDAESLRAALLAEGVATSPPVAGGRALLWTPLEGAATLPWATQAWARGELTIQDLGAMLAVEVLAPLPGERVIDWCSAPGGKAGQIWEAMESRGALLACEPVPTRRAVLESSLSRLYGEHPGLRVADLHSAEVKSFLAEGLAGAVLVDAPCLAFGLLRRHPEVRWDNRLERLSQIARLQTSILEEAGAAVAPGGRLLWVTCSPTRAELEDRIVAWLGEHTDFRLAGGLDRVPEWARPWVVADGPFLRTRPDRERVDGFGMVLLHRAPAAA